MFTGIKDHVLLGAATRLEEEDEKLARALTPDVIDATLALVPDEWLDVPRDARAAYRRYLGERLAPPRLFVEEAVRAR